MNKKEVTHPDRHYFGGSVWRMPSPSFHQWMVSSTNSRTFVLVSNPSTQGSYLRKNHERSGRSVIYTLKELKELFRDAEYMGEYYKCNCWRKCVDGD